MKITYDKLNKNGKVIETIANLKVTSFETKIKIAKIKKWFDVELKELMKYVNEIKDEFNIKERFDFDSKGRFVGSNPEEIKEEIKRKNLREEELLSVKIDLIDIELTKEEISSLDLSANDLVMLNDMNLLDLD